MACITPSRRSIAIMGVLALSGCALTAPTAERNVAPPAQQRQSCTGPQLGTWKLQSFTREDLASGQKTDLFGAHPSGYISYGPDCRMYAIVTRDGRKAPAALVPTDAERVSLYSGLIAYAGTYSIDGDRISHHVEASWNEAWTGTTVVRQFKIDGKTCTSRARRGTR